MTNGDNPRRGVAQRRAHSLRGAINAKCRDCIYDPKSGMGTWRQQVAACTVYACPLWQVRPVADAMPDGSPSPTTPEASRAWMAQEAASAGGEA